MPAGCKCLLALKTFIVCCCSLTPPRGQGARLCGEGGSWPGGWSLPPAASACLPAWANHSNPHHASSRYICIHIMSAWAVELKPSLPSPFPRRRAPPTPFSCFHCTQKILRAVSTAMVVASVGIMEIISGAGWSRSTSTILNS